MNVKRKGIKMKPSLRGVCLCVALAVGGSKVSFTSSLDRSRQAYIEIEQPNGQ